MLDFEPGGPDQDPRTTICKKSMVRTIPAPYRGVACLVLRQVYVGTQNTSRCGISGPKNIYDDWYSAKAAIGNDMNPAHILYATYTSTKWGAMFNTADIDDANFRAVADTLYTEGFGMSLIWDPFGPDRRILSNRSGNTLTRRSTPIFHTGLVKIRLIRADYDVETIPLLDDDNVATVGAIPAPDHRGTGQLGTVKFWDASTGETGSTTPCTISHRLPGRAIPIMLVLEYPGITSKTLATRWRRVNWPRGLPILPP